MKLSPEQLLAGAWRAMQLQNMVKDSAGELAIVLIWEFWAYFFSQPFQTSTKGFRNLFPITSEFKR